MDNLVLLCRNHHRLVHETGYGIRVAADKGIEFSLPDGKVIPRAPQIRSRRNVIAIKSKNPINGLEITPQTAIPQWYGDRMDHGMAVDMLLASE